MSDSTTPAAGGQYTRQAVRGFTITASTLFIARSLGPYADAIPEETVQYLMLAALVVMAYGIYQIFTSPLAMWTMDELEDAVATVRDT